MNYHTCPYKPADELGITEEERVGLITLIPRLIDGIEEFKMSNWCNCIRGELERAMGHESKRSRALDSLYIGYSLSGGSILSYGTCWDHCSNPQYATPQQAALAIVRFLSGT